MKTIIEKRADQLQPGDIIVKRDGAREVVVRAVEKDGNVVIIAATLGTNFSSPPAVWPADSTFDVEVYQLTPAQQHAEELLAAARKYLPELEDRINEYGGQAAADQHPEVIALRALLAKLAPPPPPTMEEMINAMEQLAEGAQHVADGTWDASTMQKMRDTAHDIIRRARP